MIQEFIIFTNKCREYINNFFIYRTKIDNEIIEKNISLLIKYKLKKNYKQKLKKEVIDSFMNLQESMIVDNELSIYKRIKSYNVIFKILLDHINYSHVSNLHKIRRYLINVYNIIFNKLGSENYLTEIEIERIIDETS